MRYAKQPRAARRKFCYSALCETAARSAKICQSTCETATRSAENFVTEHYAKQPRGAKICNHYTKCSMLENSFQHDTNPTHCQSNKIKANSTQPNHNIVTNKLRYHHLEYRDDQKYSHPHKDVILISLKPEHTQIEHGTLANIDPVIWQEFLSILLPLEVQFM